MTDSPIVFDIDAEFRALPSRFVQVNHIRFDQKWQVFNGVNLGVFGDTECSAKKEAISFLRSFA
jgi:hypothetical protein